MIVPRLFSGPLAAYLLLAAVLALSSPSSRTWAGTTAAPDSTVSAAEMERLTQQIEDPEQRAQLLKTLHALIAVPQQQKAEVPPQTPQPVADQSPSFFLAFGEFTQYIAAASRSLRRLLTRSQPAASRVRMLSPSTWRVPTRRRALDKSCSRGVLIRHTSSTMPASVCSAMLPSSIATSSWT